MTRNGFGWRWLVAMAWVAGLAPPLISCGGSCDNGITVAISLDPATAMADHIEVTLTIAGGGSFRSITHQPGRTTDSIHLTLDGSSNGKGLTVLAVAIKNNAAIGNGTATRTAGRCAGIVSVAVTSRTTYFFPATLNNKVDILFAIDDSPSMLPLQQKLLANFPVFMDILKALPPGLPDIHLAVVSTNTGPGQYDLPTRQCPFRGDAGRLQYTPRGACTVSPFTDPGARFLVASANQATKNYTGDITDAFNCIAALGSNGCAFGGQLKAVRWALDPFDVPAGNEGFLRPDAYLAVIVLTNQDDCSVPDDSDLMDASQTSVSDPLGPFSTFRCSEFGHLCKIGGTLQPPPRGAASNLPDCQSNDGATGKLTKVIDEVAFLKSLKSDPSQVMVSVIAGPTEPYGIETATVGTQIQPRMLHSCTQNAAEYGDPAVRLQQWARGFGDRGTLAPVCAASYAPALNQIAVQLSGLLGPQCISERLRDSDPSTPRLDPDCEVRDRFVDASGHTVETTLQACVANGNVPPCWSLDQSLTCPPSTNGSAVLLTVFRGAFPPSGLGTSVFCATCAPGVLQDGCP